MTAITQQKTAEEITEDYLNTLAAEKGITDREIGANARTEAEALGYELDSTYYQLYRNERGFYINTATGSALDSKGSDYGLTRNPAVAAIGSVDVSYSSATTIPVGSLFAAPATTARDEVQFETLRTEVVTGSGSISIPVRCTATGEVGNLAANQITSIVNPISAVTAVNNPGATTLGKDAEDDDTFRERIKRTIAGLTRGTVDSIVAASLDFEPQVMTLAVSIDAAQTFIEVSEDLNTVPISATVGTLQIESELITYTGIDTSVGPQRITGVTRGALSSTAAAHTAGVAVEEYIPTGRGRSVENVDIVESPGFVDVYLDDGTALGTSTELLQLVSRFLIGDGTARYPGYKAGGITLTGFAKSILSVDITASIVAAPGYVLADVAAEATTNVTNYLNTAKGTFLYASPPYAVIETTPGVAAITAFTMSDGASTVGPTGGLSVASTQAVRAGTITI